MVLVTLLRKVFVLLFLVGVALLVTTCNHSVYSQVIVNHDDGNNPPPVVVPPPPPSPPVNINDFITDKTEILTVEEQEDQKKDMIEKLFIKGDGTSYPWLPRYVPPE